MENRGQTKQLELLTVEVIRDDQFGLFDAPDDMSGVGSRQQVSVALLTRSLRVSILVSQ